MDGLLPNRAVEIIHSLLWYLEGPMPTLKDGLNVYFIKTEILNKIASFLSLPLRSLLATILYTIK